MRPNGLRGRARRRGNTGAIYVETVIVLPLIVYFSFLTWQLVDLAIAGYIVKHAAVCAARDAAVVGPDSVRFYGNQPQHVISSGARFDDVKEATWRALQAHKKFKQGAFNVQLSGSTTVGSMISATVNAEYPCLVPQLNAVCLGGAVRTLSATESFPYQAANVNWDH